VPEEILAIIATHVSMDRDSVGVTIERGKDASTLEVKVDIPPVRSAGSLRYRRTGLSPFQRERSGRVGEAGGSRAAG
jgi:hypothetical protein